MQKINEKLQIFQIPSKKVMKYIIIKSSFHLNNIFSKSNSNLILDKKITEIRKN